MLPIADRVCGDAGVCVETPVCVSMPYLGVCVFGVCHEVYVHLRTCVWALRRAGVCARVREVWCMRVCACVCVCMPV